MSRKYKKQLKRETLSAPKSTPSRIVFKWDQDSQKFIKPGFSSSDTQYLLKLEDSQQILKNLTKSKHYKLKTPNFILCKMLTGVIFASLILATVVNLGRYKVPWLDPVICVLIVIAMGATFQLIHTVEKSIEGESYEGRQGDFLEIVRDSVVELNLKGMFWRVGRFGAWISVDILLRSGSNQRARVGRGRSEVLELRSSQIMPLGQTRIPVAEPVRTFSRIYRGVDVGASRLLPEPMSRLGLDQSSARMRLLSFPPIINRYVDRSAKF